MPPRMELDARGNDPRPMRILKVVRYCVVKVLSRPYLVPTVLVPTIRK